MSFLDWSRGQVRRLAAVRRYSNTPVVRDENVAEHSWYVSVYALIIAEHLSLKGFEVNIGDVARRAILHDIEESIVGDIVHTARNATPEMKAAVKGVGDPAREMVFDGLDPEHVHHLVATASLAKEHTVEGCIVAIADYVSVWSYSHSEMRLGNRYYFAHIAQNAQALIEKATNDLSELDFDMAMDVRDYLLGRFGPAIWTMAELPTDNGVIMNPELFREATQE